ncbi:MAG: hypothetical protein UY81_C0054G0007 [Candidatus Giovannonibacteria bacterium GW2011_GWA2_53_7]|uniref:Uncharacterized protein n=1 Tax=Candidatus Giovannonibacteria bacterium GW2011_GWA2_53_7 TaxID=1618650 RepID=A0A0G1XV67_9BACT|nr:MAG: hypothetical protein UY81_C0054G0007 [Candidatus Giovannonibacteria bacterium GW2011_GWA2_53_7]
MILFAGIAFFLALTLIVALFAIKLSEERSGRRAMPSWRDALDSEALHIKGLLSAAELDLKKLPPLFVYWMHGVIHIAALEFARAARAASREAHRLADFVSHKRNFKRGVTRSEFLKKMGERKGGMNGGNGSNGQEQIERVEF